MILTVTLNPAIDKMVVLNDFKLHALHRLTSKERSMTLPGGKGVNIALALKLLKNEVVVTGLAAGHNGHMLCDALREKGITTNFVFTGGNTRTNISILDLKNETLTEINESGPVIEKADESFFMETYARLLHRVNWVVIGGSMPKDCAANLYADMIQLAHEYHVPVILHTAGSNLEAILNLGVHTLIPDFRGVPTYNGNDVHEVDALVLTAKQLLENSPGTRHVLLINRIENVVAMSRDKSYILRPSNLNIVNMLGYADAFVAGFVHGIHKNDSFVNALQFATACGLTNVEQVYKDLLREDSVLENLNRITTEQL